jgi:hypothetical protein
MSTTKIRSTCRIANICPDDAMILAHAANPDGSNFRKRQGYPPEKVLAFFEASPEFYPEF